MKPARLPLDLRVALLYALFSGAWILFSDRLLAAIATDLDALTRLQTYKGWAFVAISALLIFFLLRRELQLRNSAEGRIAESEKRYRLISAVASDYMYSTRLADGKLVLNWVAGAFEDITGYTLEEYVMHGGWRTTVHPDDLMQDDRDMENLRAGQHVVTEIRALTKGGQIRWLRVYAHPVLDGQSGELVEIYGAVQNITERKRAEEELRATQELFYNIFHASPLASTLATFPERRARDVNAAFEEMFGYTRAEMIGKPLTDFDFWADPSERQRAFETASRLGGLRDYEFQFKTRSGKVGYALLNTRIIEQSGAKYMLTKIMDITERKRAEEDVRTLNTELEQRVAQRTHELVEAKSFLGALVDHISSPVFYKDANLRFRGCNRAYERAFAVTRDNFVGKTVLDLEYLPQSDREVYQTEDAAMVATGQTLSREAIIPFADGREHHTLYSISGFRAPDGSPGGLVGIIVDITPLKEAEAALREAKHAAESADRVKSAFLATMSHELRTPLNSIIGFTGVLLQGLAGPLNAEQSKQMGMARDSARHLLALINDVLDISKIEAGQLEIRRAPFDMRSAIEGAMKLVLPQAQKKGIALAAAISSNVGEIVSDERRVEQILINLLNNAVKFTERGEVKLECRVRDGFIETSVHDTGIGIRAEDVAKLFAPFRQIETGLNRRHEGTGLGLSICKNLVEMLGGEIHVESEWGRGSVFTFTLPLTQTSEVLKTSEV